MSVVEDIDDTVTVCLRHKAEKWNAQRSTACSNGAVTLKILFRRVRHVCQRSNYRYVYTSVTKPTPSSDTSCSKSNCCDCTTGTPRAWRRPPPASHAYHPKTPFDSTPNCSATQPFRLPVGNVPRHPFSEGQVQVLVQVQVQVQVQQCRPRGMWPVETRIRGTTRTVRLWCGSSVLLGVKTGMDTGHAYCPK